MRRCVHFLPPGQNWRRRRHAAARLWRANSVSAPFAKDESGRFGLNAFKLLGARFAIETLLAEGAFARAPRRVRERRQSRPRRRARRTRRRLRRPRLHGARRGAGARRCHRRRRRRGHPRRWVLRRCGSHPAGGCRANGWTIVSDTAWPGYERIPFLIMLGYTRMMDEVRDQGSGIGDQGFDRRLRPGRRRRIVVRHRELVRVSSASMQGDQRRADRPRVFRHRRAPDVPVAVDGSAQHHARRPRNREVSPPAFVSLLPNVDAFMAIDDGWAHEAMRALAHRGEDPAIAAGASGQRRSAGCWRSAATIDAKRAPRLGPRRRRHGSS